MKKLQYTGAGFLVLAAIFSIFFLPSCRKEKSGGAKAITVNRVSLHNPTTTDSTITKVRVGANIRLDGSGFTSLQQIYINGIKVGVSPTYVTETNVILTVPSDLPFGNDISDVNLRNTIRLVSRTDDVTIPFIVQGAVPVISGVSHSLPKEGDVIQIFGTGFREITKLTFPGNIQVSPDLFQINPERTAITVTVPAGAATTVGAIRIDGDNGSANSPGYMNFADGVFIKLFSNDPNVAGGVAECNQRTYNFGSTNLISGNITAVLPGTGAGPKNPQTYRQVPITKTTVAVDFSAGFDFRTCAAITSVLGSTNGVIKESTTIANLAIQFDYYIPVTWSSGLIRLELISGNTQWRYNYAPWAAAGGTRTPIDMNGWQTVTVPLSAFSGINAGSKPIGTLKELLDVMVGKGGVFRFINGTFTSSGGVAYPASPIANFQISFGNFRMVPYGKPSLN